MLKERKNLLIAELQFNLSGDKLNTVKRETIMSAFNAVAAVLHKEFNAGSALSFENCVRIQVLLLRGTNRTFTINKSAMAFKKRGKEVYNVKRSYWRVNVRACVCCSGVMHDSYYVKFLNGLRVALIRNSIEVSLVRQCAGILTTVDSLKLYK